MIKDFAVPGIFFWNYALSETFESFATIKTFTTMALWSALAISVECATLPPFVWSISTMRITQPGLRIISAWIWSVDKRYWVFTVNALKKTLI